MATSDRHNSVNCGAEQKEELMGERNWFYHSYYSAGLALFSLAWVGAPADAGITGITIGMKTSPAFGGQSFGSVGQYEQVDGTATGEIDPKDPHNAVIQDIELAP